MQPLVKEDRGGGGGGGLYFAIINFKTPNPSMLHICWSRCSTQHKPLTDRTIVHDWD